MPSNPDLPRTSRTQRRFLTPQSLYEHEIRWFPEPTYKTQFIHGHLWDGANDHLPSVAVVIYSVTSYITSKHGTKGRKTRKHQEIRLATATSTTGGQSSFVIDQREL
jgi:hypothetical protein